MQARRFEAGDADRWDRFCETSYGATFLHTRRFLSYHGERFDDRSLVVHQDGGWLGVLPLAVDPSDAARVVSHPGITYGGVLHSGELRGAAMLAAFDAISRALRAQGFRRLLYKPVPHIYTLAPAQDDLYALFRLGAQRVRCDLSSCIDLAHPLPRSERRDRGLKKAQRAGLVLEGGQQVLGELWPVLEDNLQRAHQLQPVHSAAEIQVLAERFPQHIVCRVARSEKRVLAGVVLFVTPRCVHTQYIASSIEGQSVCALDLVFDAVIREAQAMQARTFDFGNSNEEQGHVLNEGLHRFKSEFGAGGVVHESYEVTL